MRCLVMPLPRDSNGKSDSNILRWKEFMLDGLKLRDDLYFILYLHEKYDGQLDDIADNDRIEIIYDLQVADFYEKQKRFNNKFVDLFSYYSGTYPVDLILTSNTIGVYPLIMALTEYGTGVPQIVVWEPGSNQLNNGQGSSIDLYNYGQILTYLFVNGTIMISNSEKKAVIEKARLRLLPSELVKLIDKIRVINLGVNIELLDEKMAMTKKNEDFTLIWGGGINANKNVNYVVKVYDKFYSYGRQIKVYLTTGSHSVKPNIAKELKKYSSIEFFPDTGYDKFLDMVAGSHAFIAASTYEGLGLAYYEMMYCGCIGVFMDRKWARANLPEDYPYIAHGFDEAYAMLKDIYDNYDERLAQYEPYRQFVKEKFDRSTSSPAFWAYVDEVYSPSRLVIKNDSTRGLLAKAHDELPPKSSLSDYEQWLINNGNCFSKQTFKHHNFKRVPSRYRIYRTLGDLYKVITEDGVIKVL